MNNPKIKLLLLVGLLAALGALFAAFGAGSHFHLGFTNGDFNFDFKFGVGDSEVALCLGVVALTAGLAGVGLALSRGAQSGSGEASVPGAGGASGFSDWAAVLRHLTKSKTDEWLGGVCGGLGEHTPLPSWVWRFLFLLLLCCYGTGILLYILLWICLPEPAKDEEKPIIGTETAK